EPSPSLARAPQHVAGARHRCNVTGAMSPVQCHRRNVTGAIPPAQSHRRLSPAHFDDVFTANASAPPMGLPLRRASNMSGERPLSSRQLAQYTRPAARTLAERGEVVLLVG